MPSTGVSILQKMSIESNFKNQYVSIFAMFGNTYRSSISFLVENKSQSDAFKPKDIYDDITTSLFLG